MCGITAFFSFTTIDKPVLDKLSLCNAAMLYRGPNEQDIWNDEKVALAHVRLSIIGVANGHQPIFNEDKSIVLICNGEIYNYISLKKELESKGHSFATLSDCEVILHLYETYGDNFNAQLEGMFAYCLYDIKKQKLITGRDIAGKKPLYYAVLSEGIVFSSEVKVIKSYFSTNTLNFEVLRQVQKYSYAIATGDTYIQAIKKIPHASFSTSSQSENVTLKKYSERNFKATFEGDYQEACNEVKRLLFSAVEKRLMSEVPIGVLLSAGVDSSAIAAVTREFRENVSVISAGYKGVFSVDERKEAKRFSDDMGLIWNEIELDSNDFSSSLEDILEHLDEPNGDVAMFAQWAIYKKAKNMGFKVLLSGNGGDELFYGYKPHNQYAESLQWIRDYYLNDIRFSAKSKLKAIVKEILFFNRNTKSDFLVNAKKTYDFPVFNELNKLAFKQQIPFERIDWHRVDTEYYIDKIYYFMHYAWLTNNCYFLSDKLAMAHSIEMRSPFADSNLIHFIDTLPLAIKFPNQQPKQLLKDSLKGIVPDYVLNRPKTGFTPPDTYINDIIYNYNPRFFSEKPKNFPQLVTDYFAAKL
ncbi:asparagine synthase (glutamine-hydrolyzing) [Flavobacterium restrictum]|uniref:asparagine synthase (glutamine-hydrolyzing) n=1 Tax=Flavobacterium restrictum TaxID=2594428 RepID=A0A553DQL8_9FLAO|nr:asparagine synthase (glutamine-hydrolyzing) [Flavobacterium restrictum]TRX35089.1 asparagine synthase (glutamine-hydrolyzing) [Flavobacterium restrictum]